jgi:methylenetetrahydrofolate reductase (NADPH)
VEHDADAVHATGIAHAAEQCRDLLANQADGLHFYTLNKSKATVDIVKALGITHAS